MQRREADSRAMHPSRLPLSALALALCMICNSVVDSCSLPLPRIFATFYPLSRYSRHILSILTHSPLLPHDEPCSNYPFIQHSEIFILHILLFSLSFLPTSCPSDLQGQGGSLSLSLSLCLSSLTHDSLYTALSPSFCCPILLLL